MRNEGGGRLASTAVREFALKVHILVRSSRALVQRPVAPTPAHLRGARGLLGWSQSELAHRAGVSVRTVKNAEAMAPDSTAVAGRPATIASIVAALQAAGITLELRSGRIGVWRTLDEERSARVLAGTSSDEGRS